MKQVFRHTVLLLFAVSVSYRTASSQTCSIVIETNLANSIHICHGVSHFTVRANFGEPLNTGSVSFFFSEDIDFAFGGQPDISWSDDRKQFTVRYPVATFTQTAYGVYAELTATTANGQDFSCRSPLFNVDSGPLCDVAFHPSTVLAEDNTLTVSVTYDTDMDTAVKPSITFNHLQDYGKIFRDGNFKWDADQRTYTAVYNVDAGDGTAQNSGIVVASGGAVSTTGAPQARCSAARPLAVDMPAFETEIILSSSEINCTSTMLTVSVQFNQRMNEANNRIVSFPNFDTGGFLTPVRAEWITGDDGSMFRIEYDVHPDVFAGNPSVDIAVAPVMNVLGRTYSGETFSGMFSVKSAPPSIDRAEVQPPQCTGVEDGEIHLNVTGDSHPYSYVWTKDDEPFAVAGASALHLGAGKYSVKITGTDGCRVSYSVTLPYPEAIVLTAVTKHHLEKHLDGEITLAVNGGIPPYIYYMNDIDMGNKTEYTNLNAGIYTFKVLDANSCTFTSSAEVKNYQIPTIFTPNSDGYNDIFMESNCVEIFNRDGTLIHSGNNGWDGRYKGHTVRPAVYFYIVRFPDGYRRKGVIQVYTQ